jgi:hypothetical protein
MFLWSFWIDFIVKSIHSYTFNVAVWQRWHDTDISYCVKCFMIQKRDLSMSHLVSGTLITSPFKSASFFLFFYFKDIKMCSEYQVLSLVHPEVWLAIANESHCIVWYTCHPVNACFSSTALIFISTAVLQQWVEISQALAGVCGHVWQQNKSGFETHGASAYIQNTMTWKLKVQRLLMVNNTYRAFRKYSYLFTYYTFCYLLCHIFCSITLVTC